jgi:anti-anti-sigma factor
MPLVKRDPSRSTVDVALSPVGLSTFTAVVSLRGEHDVATAPALADALDTILGDVLVDFSDCSFCDSSVVRVLFEASDARQRAGQRLEFLVPHTNIPVARIFEITRLSEQVPTHADIGSLHSELGASAKR